MYLDGIPLAIELAAARVRGLTVGQIVQRLDDRFHLLTGDRTALARHQTLRATIDWSYSLLTVQESTLFRRLSVFAGGWEIEAAEAVCAGTGLDSSEVLDLLLWLVDKSLILMDEYGTKTRYRMLEITREYALAWLHEAGEWEDLRTQHRAHYFQLLHHADANAGRRDERDWQHRVEADFENVRTALAYSIEREDANEALSALRSLMWLWTGRGLFSEGAEWYRRVLLQARTDTPIVAQGLVFAAGLVRLRGDFEQANVLLTRALEWARANDNRETLALALKESGSLAVYQGNLPLAREYLQESRRLWFEFHADRPPIWQLYFLAKIEMWIGDLTKARLLWEEGLTLARQSEDGYLLGWGLGGMSELALREHKFQEATRLSLDSLEWKIETQDRIGIAYTLEALGMIASEQAQARRAAILWGAAEQLRETLHAAIEVTYRDELAIYIAHAHSQLDAATFATAWAEGRAMTMEQASAYALAGDDGG